MTGIEVVEVAAKLGGALLAVIGIGKLGQKAVSTVAASEVRRHVDGCRYPTETARLIEAREESWQRSAQRLEEALGREREDREQGRRELHERIDRLDDESRQRHERVINHIEKVSQSMQELVRTVGRIEGGMNGGRKP